MRPRFLMIQGLEAGAGKSFLVAGLCRAWSAQGRRVVPFQAQSVARSTTLTEDGRQVGTSIALAARAAGVRPAPGMNPIVVQPRGWDPSAPDDRLLEILLYGTRDGFTTDRRFTLVRERRLDEMRRAAHAVAEEADLVIVEGCGAPLNRGLEGGDFANLGLARALDAPILFVHHSGTRSGAEVLAGFWDEMRFSGDRQWMGGFVLNQPSPDGEGPREDSDLGLPCFGSVAHLPHLLPRERGLARPRGGDGARVSVVELPNLYRSADVDPLLGEPGLDVRWVREPAALDGSAAVVVPASRNSSQDLEWLWARGLAERIVQLARSGAAVVGLGGGCLMLGRHIPNPRARGGGGATSALGLLDFRVEMAPDPVSRWEEMRIAADSGPLSGVAGERVRLAAVHQVRVLAGAGTGTWLEHEGDARAVGRENVWGTLSHGLFEHDRVRAAWVESLGASPAADPWDATIERDLERAAALVAGSVDLAALDEMVERFAAGSGARS